MKDVPECECWTMSESSDMCGMDDAHTFEQMEFLKHKLDIIVLQDELKVAIETIKKLTTENERLRNSSHRLTATEQYSMRMKLLA